MLQNSVINGKNFIYIKICLLIIRVGAIYIYSVYTCILGSQKHILMFILNAMLEDCLTMLEQRFFYNAGGMHSFHTESVIFSRNAFLNP